MSICYPLPAQSTLVHRTWHCPEHEPLPADRSQRTAWRPATGGSICERRPPRSGKTPRAAQRYENCDGRVPPAPRRLNLVRGPADKYRLRKDENPDPDRTAALNRVAGPAAARRGSRPWPATRDHRGATGRDREPSQCVRRAAAVSSLRVQSPRRHRKPQRRRSDQTAARPLGVVA